MNDNIHGLPPELLQQLMMNNSGSQLGDQIQMAKFRQTQGQPASPVASQPVTRENMPMMGDGTPARNKGIEVASRDTTSDVPMSMMIDKAAGEDVSQRANQEQLSSVKPGKKPSRPTVATPETSPGLGDSSPSRPRGIFSEAQGQMSSGYNALLGFLIKRLKSQANPLANR